MYTMFSPLLQSPYPGNTGSPEEQSKFRALWCVKRYIHQLAMLAVVNSQALTEPAHLSEVAMTEDS